MRGTTRVWALLESRGQPSESVRLENVTVADAAIQLVQWLARVKMGHYLRVTVARSAEELERWSGSTSQGGQLADILSEVESLFDGLDDADTEDAEDSEGED